jgi:hypothetical protein
MKWRKVGRDPNLTAGAAREIPALPVEVVRAGGSSSVS